MANPPKIATSRPLESRFSRRFLRALIRINNSEPRDTNRYRDSIRKYRRVKLAAYASMALAVGTRRAWSRATLRNIRRRKLFFKRKEVIIKKKKKKKVDGEELSEMRKLRELVPGGEDMEASCLLEETADYIKCLATQVQVMKSIADLLSCL